VPESRSLRLFFALWPGDALRGQIWDATRPAVATSGGRAVARENLHLTLAFLGNVEPALLARVREAAARVKMPGFELIVDQLGFWSRPRILLAQPSVYPRALPALVAALWKSLESLPLAAGPGAYLPHITLARKARDEPGLSLGVPLTWRVRDFYLVSSVTDPAGARYEPLARYHLIQPVDGAEGE
jgi:2'-5' RNA ligase